MTAKKPEQDQPEVGRRIFIKRSLLAATVISMPSLLTACGGGSGNSNASGDGAQASQSASSSSTSSSSSRASVASTASFAVLSDIHLYDLDSLGSNADLATYLTQDRKMLKESVPTFTSALADIATWNVDFLLISGDLTKDGELVNHKLLISKLKAFGKPVYVIPGNHDINNPNAKSYNGTTTAVDQVTPATFKSLYADYGYGSAIYTDSNSLSYIAEPVSGVWLFAIDSCKYANNATLGYPVTSGAISSATLTWITDKLAEAKAKGKTVIGMMHHGLIEHFSGQSTLFSEYLVDDRANVAARLAAAGLKVMFTGHFHANDAVSATYSGHTLYDVETGSTVTAPCPYRLCKYDRAAATLAISTSVVSSITVTNSQSDYTNASAQTFQAFAKDYLTTGLDTLVTAMLVADYGITDTTTQQQLLALIVPAMVAHYAGDEKLTSSATLATLQYMAASTDATTKLVGQMVLSLWNDAAPSDNSPTLSLSA